MSTDTTPSVFTLSQGKGSADGDTSPILLATTETQLALIGWALNNVAMAAARGAQPGSVALHAARLHHRMSLEILAMTQDHEFIPSLIAQYTETEQAAHHG